MIAAMALLFGCLVLSTPVGALSRRPPEPPSGPVEAEVATSRFEGVELVGEDADGTVWKLRAEVGWGREGERTGTLRGVQATLRKGDRDILLSAERAVVEEGRAFHFSDGVRISWGDYEVQLERAAYQMTQGMVTTDSPVEFTGPGLRISGVGVQVEVARRVVHIRARVRAVLGEEAK
ncbi:MAG TPA: LPS export ABC transporter periplasmic protein LptC [Deferrisomatales bacterium]|nr:LPS export ABC transporter periplasmic protein LptC [Deferrisomatales bacterium]